jgi:acyl transferase domain-containing protein
MKTPEDLEGVAVIGMSGRFPKARNLDEFWRNLVDGVECISFPTDEEMIASGVDAFELSHPDYVKAGCFLEDIDLFDAPFFGIGPKEAEIMDPQHRIFLETAWEALENAGYDPERYDGEIGVYAGCTMSTYMLFNLNPKLGQSLPLVLGNDKDYLSTRISYKLNLRGPSVTMQSACSTSLVAVSVACDNLLDYQCSIALAGGVATRVPHKRGYLYEQGGILSPDGHCRAFDARSQGTIFGSGVGIVALKRLKDAVADGDTIHAVIRGTAVNNDGSVKVGYTAPSVEGQARVIAMAQAMAGISPDTISYVETHGTGTSLGDPIEVAALTQAFRASTQRKGFCAIGSVKTNIGHADTAAGIAGFIKTVLALEHKLLPPSLNFERPNPDIDFENSPFYVNGKLQKWESDAAPRRAGVSAFGIGGTNAHAVLEEAPFVESVEESRPCQLLLISARTASALDAATRNLSAHLKQHPDARLADVAYTLGVGRQAFAHRRVAVCENAEAAASALDSLDPKRVFSGAHPAAERQVVFMFPGQGAQYVNMGRGLYESEPVFREQVDLCSELLRPHLGTDLREVLYPAQGRDEAATEELRQTRLTQPALFVNEYALAQLWTKWGVRPRAMIGHSIGEYVAACLAGVFTLEDALALVAARGSLMQQLPGGSMLAVSLPEEEVRPLLGEDVSLAAVNAPSLCVVSGTDAGVEALRAELAPRGVECRRLHTSHAFHSEMMSPILAPFAERVKEAGPQAPRIPFVSNVTGNWITAAEATDPGYWARHMRQPVRFAEGFRRLVEEPGRVLLEVGPGRTLSTLAKRQMEKAAGHISVTSLRHPEDSSSDEEFLLKSLGRLWLSGLKVDWANFYAGERRRRVPLPTYPFERKRYWMELQKAGGAAGAGARAAGDAPRPRRKAEVTDWFYAPSWKRSPLPAAQPDASDAPGPALIFADDCGLGSRLAERLEEAGHEVFTVRSGSEFAAPDGRAYTIRPARSEDYDSLLAELHAQGNSPARIVHLWSVTDGVAAPRPAEQVQELGFQSLLFLAQALGRRDEARGLRLLVVSNNLHEVTGEEVIQPEKATLLGPVRVIGQEYPHISCRSVDVGDPAEEKLAGQLLSELAAKPDGQVVAYRGQHRWVQSFEPLHLDAPTDANSRLRQGGVYLITGGLGGVGLTLAEYLSKTSQARLVLTGRSSLPPEAEWEDWLGLHGEEDGVSRKIRKVRELESLGGEVLVVSADASDEGQMRAAVESARARFGPINGVIHSAGVPAGGIIQLKTPSMVEPVMAPKLGGTMVLDRIFKDVPLDFFVLCSSLSSVVGGAGQVDYCAANAYLDAYACRRNSRGEGFTVSINWDAWLDVGMAAEAAARQRGAADTPAPRAKEVAHPLFDECLNGGGDEQTYVTRFSPAEHWVLSDHKVTGASTLPGTAYLEMARAAFENHTGGGTIEIRDVLFLSPLIVDDSETKEVHTVLRKRGDGCEFSIMSRTEGDGWQEHARGALALVETATPVRLGIEEIAERCREHEVTITETERQSQKGFMEFGPRWDNLRRIQFGADQGLALLELPAAFADDLTSFKLHPAMLDSATGFLSIRAQNGSPYLPFGYKSIRVKGPMCGKVYSYARFAQGQQPASGTLKIDISILDEQGRELVEIKEYMLRKVEVARPASKAEGATTAAEAENFRLEIDSPGILEDLRYRPEPRRPPRPGELEIEVCAAGLNFKEVLIATGLMPLPPGLKVAFGLECAGRVAAVGEGVEGFRVGDEVIALASPSFSPYVTTPALWAGLKPAHLSFEEAATIPVAFVTAYFSLITQGRLRRGERALIHAAAGGVGLAAVQVAQWAGAEIYATAGSDEKRDFLRALGIEHVMDSRSLSFADEVMERTGGRGVDVVLNSLGGEFLTRGLSVLAPFGRFLEIGKRDIYNDTPLGLRPFDKGLSFFAIDVTPRDTPDLANTWQQVVRHFSEATFRPLPQTVFPAAEVARAFDHMARARHIGKVVVSLEDKEALRRFAVEGEEATRQPAARKWRSAAAGHSRVERAAAVQPMMKRLSDALQAAEGLPPAEAARAFGLVLGGTLPQVLVTARDFLGRDFAGPSLEEARGETPDYKPSHPRPGLGNEYVAARTETERIIAGIWQNLLGIEQVGVFDDFFELGGDSLSATQVIARLREALQVEVAVGKMFEDPTVAGLAALVEPGRWSSQPQPPALTAETEAEREEGVL